MKINYYVVINITVISFLAGRCDGVKSRKKQEDSDSLPSESDDKTTRRPRKKASTTQDPRFEVVPKVMVFDLDYVIWPYNVAVDVKPPFALNRYVPSTTIKPKRGRKVDPMIGFDRKREIVDHNGKVLKLYEGVADLLYQLKCSGSKIAVVSQTPEFGTAEHLLNLFDIKRFIDYAEISMESNTVHIESLQKKVNCLYSEMVFFSHSEDTIDKVTDFEIISVLVGNEGLTKKDVDHCLKNYKKLTTPESC